jgi:hypothetical protein
MALARLAHKGAQRDPICIVRLLYFGVECSLADSNIPRSRLTGIDDFSVPMPNPSCSRETHA